MYQVGLMETDKHVQFFWEALASFSQVSIKWFDYIWACFVLLLCRRNWENSSNLHAIRSVYLTRVHVEKEDQTSLMFLLTPWRLHHLMDQVGNSVCVCVCVCLYACVSVLCLSVCLSIHLCVCAWMPVCLSVCICLSMCMFIFMYIHVYVLIGCSHPLAGAADSRYIRAETCLFMVKLPQYLSVEIMTDKLRYAINCREDPLSG